tara:strand:- start:40 stop:450 length:411 start_codon:yes stop_codon:yes gene_type:complete
MKKLFVLLLLTAFVFSCSSDDNEDVQEVMQLEILNNFDKDIGLVRYALKNNLGTAGIDVAVNITNGKSRKIILENIPNQSPIDVRIQVNCDNTDWNKQHKTLTVNVNDGQTTLITVVDTQSNDDASACCSCFDLVN